MLASSGPIHWDAARQFALAAATGGTPEPNPDPLERIRLEELARVAELRVADASGLPTAPGGQLVRITPVTRAEWATRTLEAYRSIFERLSTALAAGVEEETADELPAMPDDPSADLLGGMFAMLTPVLLGVQAGSMVGHLATRALGQYDLPLPRPRSDELLVVPANLNAVADEWSLPADDLRLWTCVSELATHAVLGVPHVRARLEALVLDYVGAFRPDPSSLESRFGEVDMSDPEGLQRMFGDPAQLLGALRSPAQAALLPPLEALVAVIVGVVDQIVESVASGLLSDAGRLTEALHRRRVEAAPADRLVEQLLGLELGTATFERGGAFVHGVLERGGPAALTALWRDERGLPTPAEVDAPGLWLARLEYDD
jgi:putative hydrolase